ncbi:uncharacterized protein si:dkey-86e18.1 isoform X2 [Dunckerocampus dactyliophorus]|uniref:uncharacterized protein si:dkey-86e18.1 isoform X2 n=1 Tax=Dunckerocampus dactyliophorus TaxID=161453 RepID=UPI002406AAA3|nr:uncharacterized protein si:dkey-86e18.1 isoform X2 [Dunckerocampus dactyliophorus]
MSGSRDPSCMCRTLQSTLNSASSVKKWIPSIMKEMEYYLQQSQLTHYPERKIAEFQLNIEALEKEYKRFITKLRVLDPTCKHKPWTPRAYCKRRAAKEESTTSIVKKSRLCETDSCQILGEAAPSRTSTRLVNHLESSSIPTSGCKEEAASEDQDQPLSFDHTRLAMASAAFRGALDQRGFSQTQNLARMLQLTLPNLGNSAIVPAPGRGSDMAADVGQKDAVEERRTSCGISQDKTGHVLGLDCYASSGDESDT